MRTFTYIESKKMQPRPGNTFATTYYVMHPEQRHRFRKFVISCINQLLDSAEANNSEAQLTKPLKGFKRTGNKENYSTMQIMEDLIREITGQKKDGSPKDIAQGPVGRWNKLFKGSRFEFDLEEGTPYTHANSFNKMFDTL